MKRIIKTLFFITLLQIFNSYSFDSTNQTNELSLEDKIKISYDLLENKMYLIDEKNSLFFGIEMGENISKVFKSYGYTLLPSPSDISKYEYFYDFPNVHIYVVNNEVKYFVSIYRLKKINTSRGVYVGDKVSKLKTLYGKPYKKRKQGKIVLYDYQINDFYKISFEIEKREIVRITVY